jgi:ABC-2 type transport system ATP-binding protein
LGHHDAPKTNPSLRISFTVQTTPALTIENLRVDYGDFTAVDDLSLSLEPGEIFGLVGPNGAGKTSTIRVLASLLEPTYGEVNICGHDLFEDPDSAHKALGYMPDLAPVVPNLKVWEFLDLYAHSYGFAGTEKRDRVDFCLNKVKLGDKRNLFGKELSRGMTQRVVLAKTLLHEPRLLLLDEPASGMDPIARRDLRRVLQELAAGGASVVVSSHILSELSDMCTSVGIMHQGKLLQYGSVASTLESIQTETAMVRIEMIEAVEKAMDWLKGHDRVDEIAVEGNRINFRFQGDKRDQSDLLALLIREEFRLVSFSPRETGIESLLMKLIDDE